MEARREKRLQKALAAAATGAFCWLRQIQSWQVAEHGDMNQQKTDKGQFATINGQE
jgi:hypothetical protein